MSEGGKAAARAEFLAPTPQKLWTRNFISIFLINSCLFMSFHMLTPTFAFFIVDLGSTDQVAGIAAAVISVAALLIRPFTGWFMDNRGRKLLFIIGIAIMVAVTFYYNTIQIVLLAVIFRFVQGLGWGIANTGTCTLAADSLPPRRFAEGMGFFSLTGAVALAVAPALGLFLIERFDYHVLFNISGAFAVAAILLCLIYQFAQTPPKKETGTLKAKDLFSIEAVKPAILMMLVCVPFGAVLAFIAVFAQWRELPYSGLYFFVLAGASAISRVGSGKVADKRGEGIIVILGLICTLIAVLMLSVCTTVGLFFASALMIGLGFGFCACSLQSLALRGVPFAKRGAASSTYLIAFDVGIGLGGLLAGWIATAKGYAYMFPAMIVPMAIALVLYFIFMHKMLMGNRDSQKS